MSSSIDARCRELLRRLIRSDELERRTFSRQLHDELGQFLALAQTSLFAFQEQPSNWAHFQEGVKFLERSADIARDLSQRIRPLVLDDFGLEAAATSLLGAAQAPVTGAIDLQVSLEGKRFPLEVESLLYRILQECVEEATRKSADPSGAVQLALSEANGTIRLDLTGFDRAQLAQAFERGGLTLQERLEVHNGTLAANADEESGQIRAEISLP